MKISRSRFLVLARELSELTGLECSVGRTNIMFIILMAGRLWPIVQKVVIPFIFNFFVSVLTFLTLWLVVNLVSADSLL